MQVRVGPPLKWLRSTHVFGRALWRAVVHRCTPGILAALALLQVAPRHVLLGRAARRAHLDAVAAGSIDGNPKRPRLAESTSRLEEVGSSPCCHAATAQAPAHSTVCTLRSGSGGNPRLL